MQRIPNGGKRFRETNIQGTTKIPLVIATAATPTQIYRNTDLRRVKVKKMWLYNPHGADHQTLKLLDYDLTDLAGDKDITKYIVPQIPVSPKELVILDEEDTEDWSFVEGIAGYVTTANGLEVYVSVEPIGGLNE